MGSSGSEIAATILVNQASPLFKEVFPGVCISAEIRTFLWSLTRRDTTHQVVHGTGERGVVTARHELGEGVQPTGRTSIHESPSRRRLREPETIGGGEGETGKQRE